MIDTLKRWSVELIIAIVIACVAFFAIQTHFENKTLAKRAAAAEVARDKALAEAALGRDAVQKATDLEVKVKSLQREREGLLATVAGLRDELGRRPMPPAPGPAPQDASSVLADLRAMGTSPEPLPPSKVAFPGQETPILWAWGKQSLRIPALEARIDTLQKLSDTTQAALDTTTSQLHLTEVQRDGFRDGAAHFEAAYSQEAIRGDSLKVEVGTLTTQRDRARRTRVYVGLGGFAIGSWATWKLTHR